MKFILPKGTKKPAFNLSQHWAGHMPEAAQEILDIFNYPEVYSCFGSRLPRGCVVFYRVLNLKRSTSWVAWNWKDPLCKDDSRNYRCSIFLCFCFSV